MTFILIEQLKLLIDCQVHKWVWMCGFTSHCMDFQSLSIILRHFWWKRYKCSFTVLSIIHIEPIYHFSRTHLPEVLNRDSSRADVITHLMEAQEGQTILYILSMASTTSLLRTPRFIWSGPDQRAHGPKQKDKNRMKENNKQRWQPSCCWYYITASHAEWKNKESVCCSVFG